MTYQFIRQILLLNPATWVIVRILISKPVAKLLSTRIMRITQVLRNSGID